MKPGILPPATPAQVKAQKLCELVIDAQGRTAIVLERGKDETRFLPMAPEGVFVTYSSSSVFKVRFPFSQLDEEACKKFHALRTATVHAAARCYVTHATFAGASPEAVAELERLVPITIKEKEQIMAKKAEKAEKAEKKAAKTPKAKATPKAAGEGTKKRSGASVTFRELIMQGKLTDDQIFAEVQKRHPDVDDGKRSYVAWYRNDLKKKGENPPAPKKSLKE